MSEASDTGPDLCSAKGCRSEATWQLLWNNPRIHTPDRRKVWLACAEHKESLEAFLGARGFLKDSIPHASA
ncbi:acetone carboxylase [Nocardioides sp. MH1]|uniref:acetone carboxylase n=1 Tax=Nocardioides sp. MH1 TaxID=3242490 RepID=UPI00352258DC